MFKVLKEASVQYFCSISKNNFFLMRLAKDAQSTQESSQYQGLTYLFEALL